MDFKILEHLGTLTTNETKKISKELNKVSWYGNKAVYEIRSWMNTDNAKQPLKGITLTIDELKTLKTVLNEIELG